VHPDANFAGLYQVGDSGVSGLLRLGGVCQHHDEREGKKKLFHVRFQRFWSARERRPRAMLVQGAKAAVVFVPEVAQYVTCPCAKLHRL
jgi:hypothetical protein